MKTGPAIVTPKETGTVTWTLTVTNNGPTDSSGYTVSDAVPAGYTNVASTQPVVASPAIPWPPPTVCSRSVIPT